MAQDVSSQESAPAPRLLIAVVIIAMLLIAVASVYLVQMPGILSSMLASMLAF